jgi:hypothetical protein
MVCMLVSRFKLVDRAAEPFPAMLKSVRLDQVLGAWTENSTKILEVHDVAGMTTSYQKV